MVGMTLGLAWWGARWIDERVEDPLATHVSREHIRALIADESRVFFRDAATHVGVLFVDEHRQFVPFEELPATYVASIVASEDARFWKHPGVDPRGLARAMRDNLLAGRVVAGGSTLTQQTAKNLYGRSDRSLQAKWVELIDTLRLESRFEKTEILEFYVNQFHVTGNGRGVGVAAKHFFDKAVSELTLLESAFLAGLVKAPHRYDPFVGSRERAQGAKARALHRTRYVLSRLAAVDEEQLLPSDAPSEWVAQLHAAKSEAADLLEQGFDIPFKRGVFRFDRSVLLDEVERRLGEPPIADVLSAEGIDDVASAGLTIVTTLDVDAQREATYALRRHLTEVGGSLEEPSAADYVLEGHPGPRFDPDALPVPHTFRVARVRDDAPASHGPGLSLDLGGHRCIVDAEGLRRVASTWQGSLAVGATVRASIRAVTDDGTLLCDLERRPEIQGAAVVTEAGEMRALVGGSDNANLNRALRPRRFGSTWKMLVVDVALKWGWEPTSWLDNRRTQFVFSTTQYEPRPDHEAADWLTLAQAIESSENVATVWLLMHLTDRLSPDAFEALAASVGLTPTPGESNSAYRLRMQRLGIVSDPERWEEARFLRARAEVAQSGLPITSEEEATLRSMPHGGRVDRMSAVGDATWRRSWMGVREALAGGAEPPIAGLGAETIEAVEAAIVRAALLDEVQHADRAPYAWSRLAGLRDVRTWVALRALQQRAEELGVRSEIEPVLSLPLGSSEITLVELASMFDGFASGAEVEHNAWANGRRVGPIESPATLIREIRHPDGRVLYRSTVVRKAPNELPETRRLLSGIVERGTARRAHGRVAVLGEHLRIGGKTGTSDGYRQATFAGFVPGAVGRHAVPDFIIATTVGYDDNRPMTNGRIRLAGSNGALPVWLGIARGLADAGLVRR